MDPNSPCCLRTTSYGGRGLFATRDIPKDTLLLTCDAPYASVIYRKFRKEVCGYCFGYAFDADRNAWNVKCDDQTGNGVWFCAERCRDAWGQEQNPGGFQGLMNIIVDRLAKRMKKLKGVLPSSPFASKEDLRPENITRETHDLAWRNAEKVYTRRAPQPVYLDGMELDTARFVISAIIRLHLEDTSQLSSTTSSWEAVLLLQNNEIPLVHARPHVLDSHLRIYGFIRTALLPVLQPYVETSDVVRAILAREQGNIFGLWDMATQGDSEILGWGLYVAGSYFNHDCAPNVRKERSGRMMHFYSVRDVGIGEELCTNYIDVKDKVSSRRAELLDNWYFDCACKRCDEESCEQASRRTPEG